VAQLEDVYTSAPTEVTSVDLVVPAVGRRSNEALFLSWKGRTNGRALHRLGDCVAPRMLRDVIRESYEFALTMDTKHV
jgi:hypothetical protein